MKKRIRKYLTVVLTLALCLGLVPGTVKAAEEIAIVAVEVTFGQTEARKMLEMINEFRTGDDAWAWNSSNTEKVYYTGLKELTYDYELEKAAMQRAAEIALSFSHTRPNGEKWSTVCGSANGENLAAGSSSAQATFVQWQETDDNYSGQGHRRNMLDSRFTSVGIGHVYYNGVHYWVQEFGVSNSGASATTANDSTEKVSVDIALNSVTKVEVTVAPESLTIQVGESVALPKVTSTILMEETWPGYQPCEVDASPFGWEVNNTQYAQISGDKITGKEPGATYIEATILGEKVTVPVTVKELHQHTYGEPLFTWAGDYSSAAAKFTCTDGDDIQTLTCTVTKNVTDSTCVEAGEITYTATVSFNGKTYTDTKTAAGDAATGHVWGGWTSNEDNTHTRTCSVCKVTETENCSGGVATCINKAVCEICKREYGTTDASNHIPGASDWHTDSGNHWNVCACGEIMNSAEHTYKWVIDAEATATQAGSKHEECTVCGYKKDAVEIPATGTTPEPTQPAEPTQPVEQPDVTTPADEKEPSGTSETPATGDRSNYLLWSLLALVSAACMVGVAVYGRRKKQDK